MKTPEPFYNCADKGCDDCTYPADMLFWSEKCRGFYCEPCWDSSWDSDGLRGEEPGISLADHLKQTVAVVPRELTAENGAKAALMGEFNEEINSHCLDCGGGGCEICGDNGFISLSVPVRWPTIKAIYRKAIETVEIKEKR